MMQPLESILCALVSFVDCVHLDTNYWACKVVIFVRNLVGSFDMDFDSHNYLMMIVFVGWVPQFV